MRSAVSREPHAEEWLYGNTDSRYDVHALSEKGLLSAERCVLGAYDVVAAT
jgi:hypothetical protein